MSVVTLRALYAAIIAVLDRVPNVDCRWHPDAANVFAHYKSNLDKWPDKAGDIVLQDDEWFDGELLVNTAVGRSAIKLCFRASTPFVPECKREDEAGLWRKLVFSTQISGPCWMVNSFDEALEFGEHVAKLTALVAEINACVDACGEFWYLATPHEVIVKRQAEGEEAQRQHELHRACMKALGDKLPRKNTAKRLYKDELNASRYPELVIRKGISWVRDRLEVIEMEDYVVVAKRDW